MLGSRSSLDPRTSPTRNRVYEAVASQPGRCFSDLVKVIGATSFGQVQYHLAMLEHQGFVHHVRAGRRVHYYPTGVVSRPEAVADATGTEPTRRRLLELVRERPGIRFAELQALFPSSRQNTMYHLRYLEARELVEIGRDPTAPRFQTAWPTGETAPNASAPAETPPGCEDCRKGPCCIALMPNEACPHDCGCHGTEVPA